MEIKVGRNESIVVKQDGRMWKRKHKDGKMVEIPAEMVPQILSIAHDSHHLENGKTYERLKVNFWWKEMRKDTKLFCRSCEECQWRNTPQGFENRARMQSIVVSEKFELIGVDLCTPGPVSIPDAKKYILVITDYATKWVQLVAIKDKKPHTVANAIWEEWICQYGCPKRVMSDQGGEFTDAELCAELWKLLKIKQHKTTPYHPRANGLVERFNKTMVNMIAKKTWKDQTRWDRYLKNVQLEYNMTRHSTTGEKRST
jgi:hypothetical protein